MKRIITFMMAMLMIAVLCVPTFAAETTGKITVNNAVAGETYKIYKLATLNSFDETSKAYSYTVDDAWYKFFTDHEYKAYQLFTVSQNGHYLSKANSSDNEGATIADVAKEALQYAQYSEIVEDETIVAENDTVVFENLPLGYYLVDTSLGSLCMLDTTDKEMVVKEKNSTPTIDKTVKEDSSDSYIATNDQNIHAANDFRIQVSFKLGAVNYVVHDKMSDGFVLDNTSFEVYVGMKSSNGKKLTENTDYTVSTSCEDGCTFEVSFTESFCDSLTQNRDVYIYYKAALTEAAIIAGTGNSNEAWLTYGDKQETPHDTTTTYTYQFDVVKTADKGDDDTYMYLSGATFTLYDDATGGNKIDLVEVDEHTYRVAKADDTNIADVIEMTDGKAVTICGLDGHTTYYLNEETAPTGYNKLTARREVTIEDTNLNLTEEGKAAETYANGYGGVQVVNRTGTVLPETGGVGTTMFILIGSLLVLFSGVLLATKLRMSKMRG